MQFSILLTAVALSLSGPQESCEDGPDLDRDGLSDSCELRLAAEFAPLLVVSEAACNWNSSADRLDGAYLFGVHPTDRGLRLTYLPAYLLDCGWSGPKCLLRWRGGCDPHTADSELIVVDVLLDSEGSAGVPDQVFLSAHCFGNSDADCRWWNPSSLEWLRTHPFVWVAEGKNANYPNASACDSGHWHFDTCDRNNRSIYFPVESHAQNIGSLSHPFPYHQTNADCVASAEVPLLPELPGTECIWTADSFRAWAGSAAEGVTPYGRYLIEVAKLGEQH